MSDEESKELRNKELKLGKMMIHLMLNYSRGYIFKFIALIAIAPITIFGSTNNCHAVIMSALTFTGLLVFDQLLPELAEGDIEFFKVGELCNLFKIFIFFLFCIIIIFLAFSDSVEKNIGVGVCRWVMFAITFLSSFSAVVEAVSNIPRQAYKKEQERVEENNERRE